MKIRQQAFGGSEKLLKGGLHTHTTRSDGADTPETVIRHFHANGYDFMALTDHRVYNYENFAPDLPITIIPGTEYDNEFFRDGYGFRTWHHVCLGPAKEDGNGFDHADWADARLIQPSVINTPPAAPENLTAAAVTK